LDVNVQFKHPDTKIRVAEIAPYQNFKFTRRQSGESLSGSTLDTHANHDFRGNPRNCSIFHYVQVFI